MCSRAYILMYVFVSLCECVLVYVRKCVFDFVTFCVCGRVVCLWFVHVFVSICEILAKKERRERNEFIKSVNVKAKFSQS